MTLVGSALDAVRAAHKAAQDRLAEARATVREREKDVDTAAHALPPPLSAVEQDPVLAAAAAPDDEERRLRARRHEVAGLRDEAKAVWNREGLRVVAEQRKGKGLPLDEDARFVAADNLLASYMAEWIEISRRLDLGQRIRIFNASVNRHDQTIAEQETSGVLGTISAEMRTDIARKLDEAHDEDARNARLDRMIARAMGPAE